MKYIQPVVYGKSFTCPHCDTISRQDWWHCNWKQVTYSGQNNNPLRIGTCDHCNNTTVWVFETMCYPDKNIAPSPNLDMPEEVKRLYLEASSISAKSPRGAAG